MAIADASSLVPESEPELAPAMGASVGRGVAWMVLNTGWSRAMSFAAQYFLARWLSKDDFGIYSVAISFGVFVQFFKDGGGRQLLIQKGAPAYPGLAGSVFWLALIFNTLAGGVLAALAPAVARAYANPVYLNMLLLIALSMPLSTPGAILSAKLWIDLRAGPYCMIQMGSALVRYGGAVVLAKLGFGPMSWAWPLVGLAVFEAIAYLMVTRDVAWLRRPDAALWPGLIATSKWVMLLALALAMFNQGAFLIIGKMATEEAAGVFFFASQIVMQVEMLVAFNLHQVLFPTLVRLNAEPARQREAVVRSLRTLTLLAAPAGLAVALVFEPLQRFLWPGSSPGIGKWEDAVLPVQVLAVFMSARVLYAIPDAIFQARGRFKRLSLMVLLLGLGAMIAASAGCYFGGATPLAISLWVGMYLAIACVAFAMTALMVVGVTPAALLGAIAPAWTLAALAAAITWSLDHQWLHALHPIPRIFAVSMVFALLVGPALRFLLARDVAEAVRVLPGPVRGLGLRLMRLRAT